MHSGFSKLLVLIVHFAEKKRAEHLSGFKNYLQVKRLKK